MTKPDTIVPKKPESKMIKSKPVIEINREKAVENASPGEVKYLLIAMLSTIKRTTKG